MHDPVNGGRRGHRVLEDLVPLREHQVAGDHDALAFIALSQQGEQDLHLGPVLLDIADIVQQQAVDAVQALQFPRQAQVALGFQQPFHQLGHRREQHRVALAHQLIPQRRHGVGLPGTGIAKEAHVRGPRQKLPAWQAMDLVAYGP